MGKPTPSTSTTTVNNPAQQSLYGMAMPFLSQFAANPPQLPSGGTVAGFDPAQSAGQEMALSAAGGNQQNLANTGAQLARFLSGDVLSPSTNPALQQTINAATLPISQALTESALPAIRSSAISHGQFGGSRQGIAEGLASGRASQAIGATSADIANKGYQGGLDALVKNLGLLPNTIQSQLAPALTTSGVGDVRQFLTQALLGQSGLYETYPQLLPLLMGQSLAGIGSGMQPSGTTTTGQSSSANPLMQGLGLGISGLGALGGGSGITSLLSFLGGAGGAAGAAGAAGATGAGLGSSLGAMAPLLAFSDRRLKRNIRLIGHLKGIPVYRFRYKGSAIEHTGFMADSVPVGCVVDVMGFKAVDYGMVLEHLGV